MMALSTSPPALGSAMALSIDERFTIAAQTQTSVAGVPGRIPRLSVPLSVSVSAPRLDWLRGEAVADGSRIMPVAGGGSSRLAAAATPADIFAGSNFAAALSYGDIAVAGTGTTTRTCNGEALAFGHPFGWVGTAQFGLHTAESLAIASDATYGSYKLAALGAPVGRVDQDRAAGLRGVLGPVPFSTPIRSRVIREATDRSPTDDRGTTQVADPEYMPFIALMHGVENVDAAMDRYDAGGSGAVTWAIDMRHKGETYRLVRRNQYSTPYGLAISSMIEGWSQLEQLQNNRFGRVRFDSVKLRADVSEIRRELRIRKVQVRSGGTWAVPQRALRVEPGQTLAIRTVLDRFVGGRRVSVKRERMTFTVPKRAAGGRGVISVGRSWFDDFGEEWMVMESAEEEFCFPGGSCGSAQPPAKTFGELIKRLQRAPRNDQLRATMRLATPRGTLVRQRVDDRNYTVKGGDTLPIRVLHPPRAGSEPRG
jgi:hypothetical protein